ncbi:hypothetical protein EV421DRAFT_1909935 [Armillaria borealis]|uniref:Uncharacterized protein n=1 Tax=Armillaria borealis TaxID=47425 RepID=A0AA39IZY4_9AGAR|nr:hypothetical protein EV421DRAFT_1909935 [Armillaria borealis]
MSSSDPYRHASMFTCQLPMIRILTVCLKRSTSDRNQLRLLSFTLDEAFFDWVNDNRGNEDQMNAAFNEVDGQSGAITMTDFGNGFRSNFQRPHYIWADKGRHTGPFYPLKLIQCGARHSFRDPPSSDLHLGRSKELTLIHLKMAEQHSRENGNTEDQARWIALAPLFESQPPSEDDLSSWLLISASQFNRAVFYETQHGGVEKIHEVDVNFIRRAGPERFDEDDAGLGVDKDVTEETSFRDQCVATSSDAQPVVFDTMPKPYAEVVNLIFAVNSMRSLESTSGIRLYLPEVWTLVPFWEYL